MSKKGLPPDDFRRKLIEFELKQSELAISLQPFKGFITRNHPQIIWEKRSFLKDGTKIIDADN